MAMQVHIDKARGLITTQVSGQVSDADFIAMEDLFSKSPDFSRKFSRICDLSAATGMNVSEGLMKRWAEDPVMDRTARHAIVCSDPAVMSNVLQFIRESRIHLRDASVFPTVDQAEDGVREKHE